MLALAHVSTSTLAAFLFASTTGSQTANASFRSLTSTTTASTTLKRASSTPAALPVFTATTSVSVPGRPWPVSTLYPDAGALLPFHRIVAYYGNFYSKQMGVLGQYPEEQVLAMLASTTATWAAADPATPVIPAIQYIAVVAQAGAGKEGKYILRMPDSQVDHALAMADKMHGLLFLDIQVGQSTLQYELPQLEKYLAMPNVELAIDPEFSMKFGNAPGRVIGTYDAADINYAAAYLASLVNANHLPPKILVVHRFTEAMVTNYKDIRPLPEVQIVMDMDGWGSQAKKINTYKMVIAAEPVQFTGVKLFYKNDLLPPSTGMLTPAQVLSFTPAPIYIQYQ
ncbi:MAG TPA: hypothetical protein PLW99_03185 [Candidatus Paceibacterota bacterium]|nr:MAG: hypothetical protein B7X03_02920 [Parcubacteria group bacterium 21-58-10]HQT83125.1 hypothetical protein [Candidatus Paceibacterota bacterium]